MHDMRIRGVAAVTAMAIASLWSASAAAQAPAATAPTTASKGPAAKAPTAADWAALAKLPDFTGVWELSFGGGRGGGRGAARGAGAIPQGPQLTAAATAKRKELQSVP